MRPSSLPQDALQSPEPGASRAPFTARKPDGAFGVTFRKLLPTEMFLRSEICTISSGKRKVATLDLGVGGGPLILVLPNGDYYAVSLHELVANWLHEIETTPAALTPQTHGD